MVDIRPYQGGDEAAVIALWNLTMQRDPLDEATFRAKVLLDSNFRAENLLVAEDQGLLVGFVLGLLRRVPLFLQGLESDRAWITAFGVHPRYRRQGIARHLFAQTAANLCGRRLLISPYTPNYFIPGVDTEAYPEAMAFLRAEGWQAISEPIAMRADLDGFRVPAGIEELAESLKAGRQTAVRPVRPSDFHLLMPFIADHFGWDWFRLAQECLLEMFGPGSDQVGMLVAAQGEQIVGYCQYRRERFGPFGVHPDLRGQGIGTVLLHQGLAAMLAQGFHCAWFLWTGSDAARLYRRAGFRQVRQFAIMSKPSAQEKA
jgi:ribosomal protein S18 acetylase RimI-like enzyme